MRSFGIVTSLFLGGCMIQVPLGDGALEQARRNYPPLIIGANTEAVGGPVSLRSCARAGGRVEQKGGPTFEFLGADPANPDLCRMRVGGETVEGWYGIWLTAWPGADQAYPALKRVIQGGTGTVEGFDVHMSKTLNYHDLIRNEGVESINLLDKTYRAIKISHYREGFDGNTYRSVSTIWKDLPTGLLLYGTYQHISGTPVVDDPLIPTKIVSAP